MPTNTYSQETASPVHSDTLAEDTHTGAARREHRVARRSLALLAAGEATIHRWLMRYSIVALRISMGAVYLGFGIPKYFPGVSPAQDLALATTHLLSFGLVPALVPDSAAMVLIATLECTVGLLLITGRWLRLTISLLAVHLVGILSPIVLLAGRMFDGPHHMPTLEGQYVLKDVIVLTAAMVIATTMRRRSQR
ncbi:MAG: doxx family protein [Actinomycetota bacterium]|nr:doxx family protein [Actinomycetota bacterium]